MGYTFSLISPGKWTGKFGNCKQKFEFFR